LAAALRELAEETGIWLTTSGATTALPRGAVDEEVYQTVLDAGTRLDGASLSYFANWITPAVLPIRFDTRFYAGLVVDEGIEPDPDGEELDLAEWIAPAEALERARRGTWPVPFPTRKTLDFLASFSTAEALLEHAASLEVNAVEPKLRTGADGVEIVLPGEPGFEELAAVPDGAAEMLTRYRDEGEGAVPESGKPS
jgi:8-oxo-dGTP pyrophosphatase MutT (NUDIX family)